MPLLHQERFWGDQKRKSKCFSTTSTRYRREEPLQSLRKTFLVTVFQHHAGIMTWLLQRHVLPEAAAKSSLLQLTCIPPIQACHRPSPSSSIMAVPPQHRSPCSLAPPGVWVFLTLHSGASLKSLSFGADYHLGTSLISTNPQTHIPVCPATHQTTALSITKNYFLPLVLSSWLRLIILCTK